MDDLSLDVAKGESVALRGRSGSGKSTLLNLISGIDRPDRGSVRLGPTEITALSERDRTLLRRSAIGFVYQAFNLIPTLSVRDNVRLVLELNGSKGDAAQSRVAEVLADVGLEARADARPDRLSGGEQQRVAIARALAHRPPLLLADEPTGNLDEQTADSVLDLLDRLVRQQGGTMLIATHSEAVSRFCDRAVKLHNGRIVSAKG